jgi:hypothetical protein
MWKSFPANFPPVRGNFPPNRAAIFLHANLTQHCLPSRSSASPGCPPRTVAGFVGAAPDRATAVAQLRYTRRSAVRGGVSMPAAEGLRGVRGGLRGVVISAPVLRLLHPCCGSRCACGGRRDLGATSALAAAGAAAAGGRGLMRAARAGCRAGGAWQRAAQWRVGSCRGQRSP